MEQCPLCDQTFADPPGLTAHVVGEHVPEGKTGGDGKMVLYLQPTPLSFRCVCGNAFRFEWVREGLTLRLQIPKRLLKHIELRGGWAKHILECGMGFGKKQRRSTFEDVVNIVVGMRLGKKHSSSLTGGPP